MVEQTTSGTRKSLGNVCLYRHLSRRAEQPFLRRNINYILDQHERELAEQMSVKSASTAAVSEPQLAEASRRLPLEYWSNCSTKALYEYLEQLKTYNDVLPTLSINSLGLRCSKSASASDEPTGCSLGDTTLDPGWIHERMESYAGIKCSISIQPHDFYTPSPNPKRCRTAPKSSDRRSWSQHRRGRIRVRPGCPDHLDIVLDNDQDENDDASAIAVDTNIPLFTFELDKAHQWHERSLELLPKPGPSLHLMIQVDPLHGCTDVVDSKMYDKLAGAKLQAKLTDLFTCTQNNALIDLHDGDTISDNGLMHHHYDDESLHMGHEGSQTNCKFSLQIDIGWNQLTVAHPLVRLHRMIEKSQKDEHYQLPTPSASQGSERRQDQHQITYIYQQSNRLKVDGLKCPLCETVPEYGSFERLHLHLLMQHDHFEFEVDDIAEPVDGILQKIVRFSLLEKPAAKANIHGNDQEKLNWTAPAEPFDQAALLRGQDTWTEQRRPQLAGKKRKQHRQKNDAAKEQPPSGAQPTSTTHTPGEVRTRPERKKRVHFVPSATHANGEEVRFFRTASKRILQPGELVAESDDEIDDSWLEQRQRKILKRIKIREGSRERPLSAAEQEFMVDFNRHVDNEERNGANGDRLRRDGIVRFATLYRHKMRKPGWRRQFQGKLRRLVHFGILDEATLAFCMSLAPAEQDPVVSDEDPIDLESTTNGRASGYASTRKIPRDDIPRRASHSGKRPGLQDKGICFCGQRVESNRGSIFCANHLCIRQHFHFSCVDLTERPDGWLCTDCIREADVS